jgi:hypothetical protein
MIEVLLILIHLNVKEFIHHNLQNILPSSQIHPNGYCAYRSLDCCYSHSEDKDRQTIIYNCKHPSNSEVEDLCDQICDSYPKFEFCSMSTGATLGTVFGIIVTILLLILAAVRICLYCGYCLSDELLQAGVNDQRIPTFESNQVYSPAYQPQVDSPASPN